MFIPGASSDASGSWCFSIEPKNPYRKHGLDSLEISLLGTFALTVLPLATRLPLLHAAVQCGVFKGLKEGSLPSCYSDAMAMGPQRENQFLPRASCPVLFFSSRVSCIVLSFKCHSGKVRLALVIFGGRPAGSMMLFMLRAFLAPSAPKDACGQKKRSRGQT